MNLRSNIDNVILKSSVKHVPLMCNLCDEFEKVIEYEVLILMPITLSSHSTWARKVGSGMIIGEDWYKTE
jgi:hypothetical protein